MAELVLNAKRREKTTKGTLNQLRKDGNVPGVFYSKDSEPKSFFAHQLSVNPLVFTSEAKIVNLDIEGEEYKCIVKDVQFDPVTDRVVHIDLQGITVGQLLNIEIPVVTIGDSIGVREGGRLQLNMHKIEIECLPRDIPEHFEIDISELAIGDAIHISDLKYENIKYLIPEDVTILSINAPKAIEEEPEEEVAELEDEPAEPEVIGKGKAEDSEEGENK